jgi:hypothetical protein
VRGEEKGKGRRGKGSVRSVLPLSLVGLKRQVTYVLVTAEMVEKPIEENNGQLQGEKRKSGLG